MTMTKYIECKAAIKAAELAHKMLGNPYENIREVFNAIPAADVAEVVHGKWQTIDVFSEKGYGERYYQHKECSTELYKSPYNFCPNCGADMREES